jgi:D-2-hydroxyacid dehydrogenase (NADP+)
MEKKLASYTFGIIHKTGARPFWLMDLVKKRFQPLTNINLKIIDIAYTDKNSLPSDLDFAAMDPFSTEIIEDLIEKNKNLIWIHSMWAGVDKFLQSKSLMSSDKITLTNAKGAFKVSLAEFSILSMLYFSYNIPIYQKAFANRRWEQPINSLITGKTLTIVGYGHNGIHIAKLAKGHEMKVYGVRQNINNPEGKEFLDGLYSNKDLDSLLPESDFVLSILPFTKTTIDLFNSEKFEKMKSSAVFINLGRGSSVVEEDLIKALKNKTIKAAALDVFKVEPLPADSEFYQLDNVLISNHGADRTDEYFPQSLDLLMSNLDSYLNNGKFLTIVDKEKGY